MVAGAVLAWSNMLGLVADAPNVSAYLERIKAWRRAAQFTNWVWPEHVVETVCAPLYVDQGDGHMVPWFYVDAGAVDSPDGSN